MNPGGGGPAEPLVEPLTRREREILLLLAQGCSGPEIAEKLTIALSSVRTHLQNLYGKLGVNGKRSALNHARQLGLLAPAVAGVEIFAPPGAATNTPVQVSFGAWLRQQRRALDLTQEELAQQVGCSAITLRKIESEARRPSKQTIERLADVLHVDAVDRPRLQRFARGDPFAMPAGAAALIPATAVPEQPPAHNLPRPITRFFGREDELAQLKGRLAEYRLVTLTGPGGVGKTRLSLRAAEDMLADLAGGAWFVELAPLTDPALVAQHVAVTLGVHEESGRPILETLTTHLRECPALLVLDNCEHVLAACAQLAGTLLRVCPRVTILATSREPLGIAGESIFAVPSLSFPDPDHLPAIESLIDYVSVRLFVDRARLVLPDYQVTPHNALGLARLCQRLDGIPLAIEMAAARVNLLTTAQLADRLDDACRLLTAGSRSALPRQQTLRATLDWSYQLLGPLERLLFQRLSVFTGGCRLEAIEAVCTTAVLPAVEVLDVLASLVAKSMVQVDRRQGEEARYRLLELMRQFADEKLHKAGADDGLPARHRDYYLAYAETNVPKLHTGERLMWTQKLADDQGNLRLALEWSFRDPTSVETGPRLVLAMNGLWLSQQENLDWLKRAITFCQGHSAVSASLHAAVLGMASRWAALNDPQAAVTWARQAVYVSRGLGPAGKKSLMDNLYDLGWIGMMGLVHLDDVADALAPFVEAESLLQELGPDQLPTERFLSTMGSFALLQANEASQRGQYKESRLRAGESSRLYERARNPWGSYLAQICMGSADLNLGEYDQARDHFLQALRLGDEIGNISRKAYVRRWLSLVELRQSNVERAQDYCRVSLEQAAKTGDHRILASCLGVLASIRASQGQSEVAARLSGASQSLYARLNQQPWEDASLDILLPRWHTRLDQAAIWQAYKEGQAMSPARAAADALGVAAA